jgi:hypothetical protein
MKELKKNIVGAWSNLPFMKDFCKDLITFYETTKKNDNNLVNITTKQSILTMINFKDYSKSFKVSMWYKIMVCFTLATLTTKDQQPSNFKKC